MKLKTCSHFSPCLASLNVRSGLWVLMLILLISVPLRTPAQDQDKVMEAVEEMTQKPPPIQGEGPYEKGYYQSIPVQSVDTLQAKAMEEGFRKSIEGRYQGSTFDYQEESLIQLSWWDRLVRRLKQWMKQLLPDWNIQPDKIVYYSLICFGLLALIYVVYKLVVSGHGFFQKQATESEEEGSPEWIERRLETLNLDHFLSEALQEQDFTLAIRYLHLINLKKLAASGQIDWHYQKTNQDFFYELKDQQIKNDFKATSRIYDYVWYGHFPVNRHKYEQYAPLFHQFNQSIK